MQTLVIVHPMRDPASFTVNRKAQKIFIHREAYSLNPSDHNALEAALQLGHPVTAVALGEAPADDYLRLARAMGAERAVRIPVTGPVEACQATTLLLQALESLGGADLILLGDQVLDADLAQIGPRLAEALGRPLITGAHQITVADGQCITVAAHAGAFHRMTSGLPAVITVAPHSNQPRYAHGRNIMRYYAEPEAVEVLPLGESPAAVEVRGESYPPERELGTKLSGALPDLVRQVTTLIRNQ